MEQKQTGVKQEVSRDLYAEPVGNFTAKALLFWRKTGVCALFSLYLDAALKAAQCSGFSLYSV